MGSYILKREGIKMDDVVHKNQMKLLELKIETLKNFRMGWWRSSGLTAVTSRWILR